MYSSKSVPANEGTMVYISICIASFWHLRDGLSSEFGTHKTVKARFWTSLSSESPENLFEDFNFQGKVLITFFKFSLRSEADLRDAHLFLIDRL